MSSTELQRVVLVTGGGRGIGEAITRAFIEQNDQAVIAQSTPAKIGSAAWLETDFSDLAVCDALIDQVIERFGRLDVLVNNAGRMTEAPLATTSLEEWQATISLNLTVPFMLSKAAIPHLQQTRGCIINIGSIEGLASNPGHAAYCASKAGLHALTRATAVDHGDRVRCNSIAPGWIDTELNAQFVSQRSESFHQELARIHPSGRIGMPEDVASLAVFLASKQAEFMNGQTVTLDGGRTIKLPLPE